MHAPNWKTLARNNCEIFPDSVIVSLKLWLQVFSEFNQSQVSIICSFLTVKKGTSEKPSEKDVAPSE